MENFKIGDIVIFDVFSPQCIVLVTGANKKNVGYLSFEGVVIASTDLDNPIHALGRYSTTWSTIAFKKLSIDINNLIIKEINNINEYMYIQITDQGWQHLKATVGQEYIKNFIETRKVIINNEGWYKLQCKDVVDLLPANYWGPILKI